MSRGGGPIRDRALGAVRDRALDLSRPASALLLAAAYPLALLITDAVVRARPLAQQEAWRAWASTNLDNLADHPVAAMICSAFVGDESPVPWLLPAAVALWAAARVLGTGQAVLVLGATHAIATLISQSITAHRIAVGAADPVVRAARDIGPSYVVAGALAIGLVLGGRAERVGCAALLVVLVPSLVDGLVSWQIAPLGHVAALLLAPAAAAGVRLARRR